MTGFPSSRPATGIPDEPAGGGRGAGSAEYGPNLREPTAWSSRIRGVGRFVRADVLVMGCIRFCPHAGTSWRTMDREASTEGTVALGTAGAETCGGVMVRSANSGNRAQSPVHYLDSANLAAGMRADGALAARHPALSEDRI